MVISRSEITEGLQMLLVKDDAEYSNEEFDFAVRSYFSQADTMSLNEVYDFLVIDGVSVDAKTIVTDDQYYTPQAALKKKIGNYVYARTDGHERFMASQNDCVFEKTAAGEFRILDAEASAIVIRAFEMKSRTRKPKVDFTIPKDMLRYFMNDLRPSQYVIPSLTEAAKFMKVYTALNPKSFIEAVAACQDILASYRKNQPK